jgi:putative thioredoxin
VKQFVDRIAAQAPGGAGPEPDPAIAQALEQAKARLDAGDARAAAALYSRIAAHDPENLPAIAGLARASLASGDVTAAKKALDELSEDEKTDKDIAGAITALALAEKAAGAGDASTLQARVDADPADHQARFDLALALYAQGNREAAIDQLIESVRRARTWNEEAARKQLIEFFEAMGPTDPITLAGRRKLSSVLFS